MQFDLRALPPGAAYRLMASTITPRPIAWLTTLSKAGVRNAAPFSFFNMVGAAPPTIVIGIMRRVDGTLKDSAANILETGEFVVNLVGESDVAAMNLTSMDAPADIDEIACAGLETCASALVAPPRIASAPASFECRKADVLARGEVMVVIADVLVVHIRDEFVTDVARYHVDAPAMRLIGRLHGTGWYARQGDSFRLDRPVYVEGTGSESPLLPDV